MSPRLPVLAVALSMMVAAPAGAATFYAAPSAAGGGDCSSAANPCMFLTAVPAASHAADVVELASGSYPVINTAVNQFSNFTLRGASSWNRPVLRFASSGQLRLEASSVRDVDFTSTSPGLAALRDNGGTLERLRITSTATSGIGLELYNGI